MSKTMNHILKNEEAGIDLLAFYEDLQSNATAFDEFWQSLDADNAEVRRQTGVIDHQREIDEGEK